MNTSTWCASKRRAGLGTRGGGGLVDRAGVQAATATSVKNPTIVQLFANHIFTTTHPLTFRAKAPAG